ncbi:uncharacterized protein LOC142210345 isoform X1 [Leptodactylus fuscus]|uniref:uncharacterized protein LOC142210345 isoform X1 n=2 Tax=Leptodactylus fuscus TaxID=238119 RepID=UPI003F4E6FFE
MHAFPRSMDRIKAWLLLTGQMFEDLDELAQRIYDGKKNSAHRLCSAHFTIDSYIVNKTNKVLRADALPSIFPPPGGPHSRKRARRLKKNKDSSPLSNSLTSLLWHESSRAEAWTKREYLFQGAETQTDLSCFDTGDLHLYNRSLSDKEFQHVFCDHPRVFEQSLPDASQSLFAGIKEEQVQFPCSEDDHRLTPAPKEHPSLLTSIKSEKINEHPVDQHEEVIHHFVIDFPKEEVSHLTFAGLEGKTNSRGRHQSLVEAEEMPKCIVKGCLHYSGWKYSTPGVTLHMFPKDLNTIKKWLQQTNQDYGDLDLFAQGILRGKTGVSRICSAHFTPDCYTLVGSQKVLVEGAIPTIFPERDKPSKRMETVSSPVLQNIYLPINMWMNNVSVVSNVAPWGANQIVIPTITMNPNNNVVANDFGVTISRSATECKQEERPNELGNPPTTFNKCPYPSPYTYAGLSGTMQHKQSNTNTGPGFSDLSTRKINRGVQWPEYENNMEGESWKVMHDHLYETPYRSKYESFNQCSLKTEYTSKDGFEDRDTEMELFSMLQYVASVFKVNKSKDLKTARILNQALEIISLINEEFPVKCGDMAVYFTMDEWRYIDQHKEDYEDIVTDNVPMNQTWQVPEQWNSAPTYSAAQYKLSEESVQITEVKEEEEEDLEDSPDEKEEEPVSSEWEPESEVEDEEAHDKGEESSESPEISASVEEPQITHKCDQCEESFPDIEALEAHKATHVEKCEDCEEVFSSKPELIKHRAENHAMKRFACTICGIEYDYKSQFVIHQRAHTREKPFHCDDCGAKFGYKSSLLLHQRRHLEGKAFQCSKCERRFDKRCELARHEKDHERKKQNKCQKCGKTFIKKAALERHKLSGNRCKVANDETLQKKKPYKCRKCGKTFVNKGTYVKHKWYHDGEDD